MRHTRGGRWEGGMQYRRIFNGFPGFRLAVFSITWYKVPYMQDCFGIFDHFPRPNLRTVKKWYQSQHIY